MKTAIVCEGGGMRGIYTAGVLEAFMEAGFVADALYGVSAGASNGMSYVSGQQGRGLRTNTDYTGDKRYLSFSSLLKTGSAFGMDFIFNEIPDKLDPFDFDAFYASPCRFYAGVTDVETGKPVFFGKEDITRDLEVIKASCALPMLSGMVEYKGRKYMDGGISDPIPLDQALAVGYDRIIVILTQHREYTKKRMDLRPVYHVLYRKYPRFVRTLDVRHMIYNHTLERLRRMEGKGQVLVVAPRQPLGIDRFAKDKQQLFSAYETGVADGGELVNNIDF